MASLTHSLTQLSLCMFAPYSTSWFHSVWSCWVYSSNVMLWARFIVLMLEIASVDDTDRLSAVDHPFVSLPEVFERLTLHVSPKHGQVCLHITLVSACEPEYRDVLLYKCFSP